MDTKDWRINTVTTVTKDTILPWNGKTIEKGAVLTAVSVVKLNKKKFLNIPVPNATAMCLKISYERYKQANAIKEASGINKSIKKSITFESDEDAIDYAELMFESVIMAFTALEAFANELIPEDFESWEHKQSKVILEKKDKREIERYSSTVHKFDQVLPKVFNIDSPKGSKCWQDLVALKRIRDRITHMKTEDRRSSGHEISTIWNEIYKIEAPYKQALSIVKYFVKCMEKAPRWYDLCAFKNL